MTAARCAVTVVTLSERKFRIVICRGPECGDRRGSAALHERFRGLVETHGVRERCEVAWQSCYGRCTQGPNVLVREILAAEPPKFGIGLATLPGPRSLTALYNRVDAERAERIILEHVVQERIARDLIESPGAPGIRVSIPVASKTKEPEQ